MQLEDPRHPPPRTWLSPVRRSPFSRPVARSRSTERSDTAVEHEDSAMTVPPPSRRSSSPCAHEISPAAEDGDMYGVRRRREHTSIDDVIASWRALPQSTSPRRFADVNHADLDAARSSALAIPGSRRWCLRRERWPLARRFHTDDRLVHSHAHAVGTFEEFEIDLHAWHVGLSIQSTPRRCWSRSPRRGRSTKRSNSPATCATARVQDDHATPDLLSEPNERLKK